MTHSGGNVLGVDGCRAGWVGIVLASDGSVRGVFGTTMAELAAGAGPVDAVGIDSGIAEHGNRMFELERVLLVGVGAHSLSLRQYALHSITRRQELVTPLPSNSRMMCEH